MSAGLEVGGQVARDFEADFLFRHLRLGPSLFHNPFPAACVSTGRVAGFSLMARISGKHGKYAAFGAIGQTDLARF
jgi:hypothetical protein